MPARFRPRPPALILSALAAAAACADPAGPTAAPQRSDVPSFARDAADEGQPIPGQYIVVFRDAVADPEAKAHEKTARLGGKKPKFVYRRALKGFAGELSEADVAALRADADVAYVEQDQVVSASTRQEGATWGLDRIDQRDLPLSTTFSYTSDGAGVHAYIVDTGILLSHAEFAGRLGTGFDAVTANGSANDCHGHGTHVAGTVGGTVHGVAKGVTLYPVRVLGCNGSGTNAGVIAGVDFVAGTRTRPAVANMSLGGGASTALDDAVRRAIGAGVTFSLAAGNGNFLGIAQDACRTSPARVREAITVGATDRNDRKASFSNFGTCLDIFAPGVGITSAWHTTATATNTISGTSMAAPHVAGVAALYLQANTGASPAAVAAALTTGASAKKVGSPGKGSPNLLLFSAY